MISLLVCSTLFIGCNNKIITEKVAGRVTFDGTPLAGAIVNFSPRNPEEGTPSYAMTDREGYYRLQTLLGNPDAGTTPGEYIVSVVKSELVPSGQTLSTNIDGRQEEEDEMISISLIPEIYTSKNTTPLHAKVKKGRNTIDFSLRSEP